MEFPTPFSAHAETVRPEWIDYNGHMNVAYYVLVFDRATDTLFDALGLGAAYRQATDLTLFVVESHILYEREVALGAPLRIESRILGVDGKAAGNIPEPTVGPTQAQMGNAKDRRRMCGVDGVIVGTRAGFNDGEQAGNSD